MKQLMNFLFFCICFSAGNYAQEDFNLTIERKLSTDNCTMGYLVISGEVVCYTLELPWKDNRNNISCIPVGTYNGILRYDKKDGWRVQLENVPGRTGVQIHMGNYTREIAGCILIGTDGKIDDCSVFNSSKAYSRLKNAFYGTENPVSTPNKTIKITFK